MSANNHFVEHLIIDGYGCSSFLLNNKNKIAGLIDAIIEATDMKQLSEIHLYEVEGVPNTKDTGGVTGIVVINESHISIHTFPNREYVSIDIFTCKNGLDVEKIVRLCKFSLEIKECDTSLIKRGLHFPKEDI